MMKNRYFMLGLGAGLIAGALLLQLMIAGRAAPMTREELVREAARLNLTVVDPADAAAQATASPDEGAPGGPAQGVDGEPAAEATQAAVPSATPAPAATPKAAAAPSAAATPGSPSAPAQPESSPAGGEAKAPAAPESPESAANGAISVRIPTGITLAQTADVLAEAGVIQDKDKFLQAANSRKVNKIIQYGSYSFAKGESINSIIDKLITVKK
ncbi:hypothetical protein MHI24_03020 [Paenibacillus sp. FSL K6-1096]|uniref:hypothetical protein n=1 Tax=Paenibacillus sp. FSL K6-1096 TaxID=2921460 RepID=UPI0030EEFE72